MATSSSSWSATAPHHSIGESTARDTSEVPWTITNALTLAVHPLSWEPRSKFGIVRTTISISSGLIRVMAQSARCLTMKSVLISKTLTFKGSICGNAMVAMIRNGGQSRSASTEKTLQHLQVLSVWGYAAMAAAQTIFTPGLVDPVASNVCWALHIFLHT
mmetsp:Transcript_17277/g.21941  ORF Transcript_17277/g.21941 Transcript_17277/m.21941 type:complete len:160 (+) Transcript_17277:192-671(+)